jgi:uncharacterized protein (DUF305 family)
MSRHHHPRQNSKETYEQSNDVNNRDAFCCCAKRVWGGFYARHEHGHHDPTDPKPGNCKQSHSVATATTSGMAGMDHGSGNSMSMDAPYDAMFMDGMIVHHQGAIDMAKEAQQKGTKPEIKQLAETIVKTQQAEIDQMRAWRKQWYPTVADMGDRAMNMGAMAVSEGTELYDLRFISAMIPHHESALVMANDALQRAEKPEIKALAETIIKAQTAEIEQMKQWYAAWAGKPYIGAMMGMDHGAMPTPGNLNIAFSTEPPALKVGTPGALVIVLTDKEGKPVEGADVNVTLTMTTMNMGEMKGTATDEGGGRYTIKTSFGHGGKLKIEVAAAKDKLSAAQTFNTEAR